MATRKAKPRRRAPTLTARQQRFVDEFLIDLNGTQAAIRAGYSPKSAERYSIDLLRIPHVRAAVEEGKAKRSTKTGITAERVLQEIQRIAYLDPRKLYRRDGSLKLPHELDDDAAAALASLEVVEEFSGRGGRRRVVGYTRKVRYWNKVEALALLCKHLGLTPDRSFNVDLTNLSDEQLRRLAEGEDVLSVLTAQSPGRAASA